ncbi:hypothetical protein E4U45_001823 [Claviceps purpurea]|nr:hypothetical protein E4U45_001823 [Claviceps purpurea]
MTTLIPLALGKECYATRDNDCLPSYDDLLSRFPSVPSKPRSSRPVPQPLCLRATKRQSKTEHVPESPATPCTDMEWKATLGEIKREYMNRRFRQCFTRCHEVLAQGDKFAHPIHLVYVRFYAATALEMQARAIHHSSPFRTTLLKQAYDHYSIASDLATQADQQVTDRSPHARNSRFSFSKLHSPAGSNASYSTASTGMSSPSPSLYSSRGGDDAFAKPSPKKKKVAFSDELIIEPMIRPDSPTLGFDDWIARSFPEPILSPPESILKSVKRPPLINTADDSPRTPDFSDLGLPEDDAEDPFSHTRSVHRFCTILGSLRRQITSHLTTLDIEIAACQIPTVSYAASPEMKALDIQARIERLRACGWRRARFNVQRYEALRENALADMME